MKCLVQCGWRSSRPSRHGLSTGLTWHRVFLYVGPSTSYPWLHHLHPPRQNTELAVGCLSRARFVWGGRGGQSKRSIPLESWHLGDSRNDFFFNLRAPFFGNVGFVKFGTFSALLALPVTVRKGHWQIACQTLPNILLSNASLVTKSCITRFFDDDAFNPTTLSDCSTGLSPPLAHGKSTCRHSMPTPAVYGPAYLVAYARFPTKRLTAVGKFERSVKDHLFMFLKLRFRVLRRNRNDTFLRASVNILSFLLDLRQVAQCQRLYSTPATDVSVLVADRSRRHSPAPPRPPPPDWPRPTAGRVERWKIVTAKIQLRCWKEVALGSWSSRCTENNNFVLMCKDDASMALNYRFIIKTTN